MKAPIGPGIDEADLTRLLQVRDVDDADTLLLATGLYPGEGVGGDVEPGVLAVFEKRPNEYSQTPPGGSAFGKMIRDGKVGVIHSRPLDLSIDDDQQLYGLLPADAARSIARSPTSTGTRCPAAPST